MTTRKVTKVGGGYITKYVYPDGTVVKAFASTPLKASGGLTKQSRTVTAKAGIANALSTTATEISISGDLAPVTSGSKSDPAPATTMSAYDELIAMGVSPEEAAPFAQDASGPVQTSNSTAINSGSVTPYSTTGPGQQYGDPLCVDIDFDGSHGHVHGCDTQYKIWSNGANWYMQDKHLATASMHDTGCTYCDHVTGLLFGFDYPNNGNVVTDWAPSDWFAIKGSCVTKTTTTTVGIGGDSYTLSSSWVECPQNWGVYAITNTRFWTKWDGAGNGPSDGSRATHGVATVHSPVGASINRTVHWQYWYTTT